MAETTCKEADQLIHAKVKSEGSIGEKGLPTARRRRIVFCLLRLDIACRYMEIGVSSSAVRNIGEGAECTSREPHANPTERKTSVGGIVAGVDSGSGA